MRSPSERIYRWTRRTLAALLCCAATGVLAADVRMLVQHSPLAGFRYYEARQAFAQLIVGEPLDLVREPDNPHDAHAVRVEWRGRKLGYVPRASNSTLAWAMDAGEPVSARVARLTSHPNPRRRIEFEVFVE